MKKLISLLISILMILSVLGMTACGEPKQVSLIYGTPQSTMQALKSGNVDFALLPEPAATNFETNVGAGTTWYRMSLQELYDGQTKSYPQAVLMVKNDVLEGYPQLVREVGLEFSDNVQWVKENTATAIKQINALISDQNKTPSLNAEVITSKVIDNCKIEWQPSQNAKEQVKKYIDNLLSLDIGLGNTPATKVDDDFFYVDNNGSGNAIDRTFTFVAPDGAPALSIAKFINDNENFVEGATFNYNVVDAESIASKVGTTDFVVVPVNLASKLYKAKQYKMVSVITHGNLYVLSKTPSTIADLDGKKVGVAGNEGLVPDLTLKVMLQNNNFNYSKIA